MKCRILPVLLALLMLLCALPVSAEETTAPTTSERAPGYCGEAILWNLEDGTLTITGTGPMDDFPDGAPWEEHKDDIRKVIISDMITYVGAYSFCDYDSLTDVQFGGDVYEIGERAFFSCDGLTEVHLPASFKVFGPSSFMGCTRLKEFHCEGRFPSFRQNCLWDTYATIYFPAGRPWGVEYIAQLEEAFHGRIEFLASDGSDPYDPTEAPAETEAPTTEAPTEETTEPTEAPTTMPPTTEPPVTEPEPTQTLPAETDETSGAVTEPSVVVPSTENSGSVLITVLSILTAASFLVFVGSIIFGRRKRRRYYR